MSRKSSSYSLYFFFQSFVCCSNFFIVELYFFYWLWMNPSFSSSYFHFNCSSNFENSSAYSSFFSLSITCCSSASSSSSISSCFILSFYCLSSLISALLCNIHCSIISFSSCRTTSYSSLLSIDIPGPTIKEPISMTSSLSLLYSWLMRKGIQPMISSRSFSFVLLVGMPTTYTN